MEIDSQLFPSNHNQLCNTEKKKNYQNFSNRKKTIYLLYRGL